MATDKGKRCNSCGETKPLSEFGNRHDRPCGKRAKCKDCAAAYNRKYMPTWSAKPENKQRLAHHGRRHYEANKERILARHKEWRAANPATAKRLGREGVLRREYGLTPTEVGVMLGQQEGLCAICARVLEAGRRTHVDHCHTSGKIRALLCGECNRALGLLHDKPEVARAAAEYLERHA